MLVFDLLRNRVEKANGIVATCLRWSVRPASIQIDGPTLSRQPVASVLGYSVEAANSCSECNLDCWTG